MYLFSVEERNDVIFFTKYKTSRNIITYLNFYELTSISCLVARFQFSNDFNHRPISLLAVFLYRVSARISNSIIRSIFQYQQSDRTENQSNFLALSTKHSTLMSLKNQIFHFQVSTQNYTKTLMYNTKNTY